MSIVIVRNSFGYIASLRFGDKFFDEDISSTNKKGLYKLIDKKVAEWQERQSF